MRAKLPILWSISITTAPITVVSEIKEILFAYRQLLEPASNRAESVTRPPDKLPRISLARTKEAK